MIDPIFSFDTEYKPDLKRQTLVQGVGEAVYVSEYEDKIFSLEDIKALFPEGCNKLKFSVNSSPFSADLTMQPVIEREENDEEYNARISYKPPTYIERLHQQLAKYDKQIKDVKKLQELNSPKIK